MPGLTRRHPDIAKAIVTALTSLVGAGHTGIETPTDLAGKLPFIRVINRGGQRDPVNGLVTFTVDVFAPSYAVGEPLAEQCVEYLCGPGAPPIAAIDRITCTNTPSELPWGDPTIRRFGSTFESVARRRLV
jgi:hypothetical protein